MILKLAALGAIGYAGYKFYESQQNPTARAAFASGETGTVRNAGAEATRSADTMSKQDEALDETFPASDPVTQY